MESPYERIKEAAFRKEEAKMESLLPVILALQFAAFGWRITREIAVGDQRRKTWLPLFDYLNILSFAAVVFVCVILPLLGVTSYTRCKNRKA